jgi:hypothetical protein
MAQRPLVSKSLCYLEAAARSEEEMAGQQRSRQLCQADNIGVDRRFHARRPLQLNKPICHHFCRQFDPSKAAPPVANMKHLFWCQRSWARGLKSLLEQDSKPNRPFTSLRKQPLLAAGWHRGLWFQSLFVFNIG